MTSDPEHDAVVMTLVERALGLPAEARHNFLRTACAGDERLLEETSERVSREERMGMFLLEPVGPLLNHDQQFAPGQLLAGRFEIVREVGEGGMARVYEAMDHRLDRRIAIKYPKAIFSGRLPPEARNALKVAHDNVCRVHEIHTAITNDNEVEFLTMEFLDGETLRARLDREKRLNLEDTANIARQLCAGLEEAHRKGIVHGDLKPNNIMLTRTAEGQVRVVITDFGLARPFPGNEPPLPGSPLFGVPDYIAPELQRGGSRSVASDLFALGVILFEALSGERPWSEDSEGKQRKALPPDRLPPNVPSKWSRVILPCLNPLPTARPRSAGAVIKKLDQNWPPVLIWLTSAAGLMACLVAGLFIGPTIFPSPPLNTIRLAVLPFEADAASKVLASGIAQEVSNRLGRVKRGGEGMIVIPPGDATRNRATTPRTASSALGATHTLQADFHQAGAKLFAHATVRDTQTEQIMRSFSAEYAQAEVALLPKALLGTVTAGLRLKGVSIPETVQPVAYADYVQGMHYVKDDAHLASRAIPFFERSAKLDQHSALPYAGMVESQVLMFETKKDRQWLTRAEESLQEAKKRNQDAFEVHLAAGRVNRAAGRPERALEDFRRAVQLEPGNPDALRGLAGDYGQLGLANDALQTFQQAIKARPGYYLPHQDLGIFHYYRGQYPDALTQFQIVTGLVPAMAQGHLNLGGAYTRLGRYPEGEIEMRQALKLREDRDTWTSLGAVLAYEKRHQESAAAYERAAAMGGPSDLTLSNLADAYRRCGRSSEAREAYKRALRVVDLELTEGDPGSGSGPVRALAGYLSARLGDRAAEREIKEALRLSPENADVRWRAVLTFEVLGKRDATLKLLEHAPQTLIEDLSRQPDLADLQRDSRFSLLLSKSK